MNIIVTHKLAFSHEGREFTTLTSDGGVHEAPDFIVNDPYFSANEKEGRITVVSDDPRSAVAPVSGEVVETPESGEEGTSPDPAVEVAPEGGETSEGAEHVEAPEGSAPIEGEEGTEAVVETPSRRR